MDIHLVRREAEVPHRQVELRVGAVDQGLQPGVMLLAVRQAAADDGDMVALLQLDQRLGGVGASNEDN